MRKVTKKQLTLARHVWWKNGTMIKTIIKEEICPLGRPC